MAEGFGLTPDAMSQGLYDGGDTICAKHYFTTYDYEGTVKPPATVLAVDMIPQDGETEPFTQYMGTGKGCIPVNGGEGVGPAPGAKKTGLGATSGAGLYLRSLINPVDDPDNGMPREQVGTKVSVFDGIRVNLKRIERKAFSGEKAGAVKGGLTGKDTKKEDKGPSSTLVASEIIALPGKPGAKKAAAATAKAGKTRTPPPEPEETPDEEAGGVEATDEQRKRASKMVVQELKKENLTQQQLGQRIFKALKGDEDQAVISQLIADDDFMGRAEAPWSEEDGTYSL